MSAPSSAASLFAHIGKELLLRCDDLWMRVQVRDARSSYGNLHFLVVPVAGTGEQWVAESRCTEPARAGQGQS